MSTGGPSDPVRRTRIRWGTGGGAISLVVGVIGGLLVGGNLTVLGVGAVGAVAAVAGVVLAAIGQVMAHSDRRYTRGKDELDRLERAESRARARAEAHQQVRDDAGLYDMTRGEARHVVEPVMCSWVRLQGQRQAWAQPNGGAGVCFEVTPDSWLAGSVAGQGVAPVVAVQHGGQQFGTQTTTVAAGPVDVQPQ